MYSPYDLIAGFYHRGWADWYLPSIRPVLEQLLFPAVPSGGRLLDLCCGCGHVTKDVLARGYRVTGLDSSAELLQHARHDLPGAAFICADARRFTLNMRFDGALSTFDSLNHMLRYEDLVSAFRCTRAVLKDGAPFVFDMNLEAAYSLDLGEWNVSRSEDSVGLVRGLYNRTLKRAATELTWFTRTLEEGAGTWVRHDAVVEEQCYSTDEIREAIAAGGFSRNQLYTPAQLHIADELSFGRIYGRAWA